MSDVRKADPSRAIIAQIMAALLPSKATLISAKSDDWASATFTGARHEFEFLLGGEDARLEFDQIESSLRAKRGNPYYGAASGLPRRSAPRKDECAELIESESSEVLHHFAHNIAEIDFSIGGHIVADIAATCREGKYLFVEALSVEAV